MTQLLKQNHVRLLKSFRSSYKKFKKLFAQPLIAMTIRTEFLTSTTNDYRAIFR